MTTEHRGKKVSPFTIIQIMARAQAGERTCVLAAEHGVHRATINRWLFRWGNEAALVHQLEAGRLALQAVKQIARKDIKKTG